MCSAPNSSLFSVTLTAQSPLPQTSSSIPACWAVFSARCSGEHSRHTLLSFGSQDSTALAPVFLAFRGMCFWLLFSFQYSSTYINAPRIIGWSCNLPELPCDKLQTSSVSRGQMFTRVSNLITAENREKTSKCNLTGCKATGHPLSFYGMGRGGSSEAK